MPLSLFVPYAKSSITSAHRGIGIRDIFTVNTKLQLGSLPQSRRFLPGTRRKFAARLTVVERRVTGVAESTSPLLTNTHDSRFTITHVLRMHAYRTIPARRRSLSPRHLTDHTTAYNECATQRDVHSHISYIREKNARARRAAPADRSFVPFVHSRSPTRLLFQRSRWKRDML